ncbi:hypothetical protein GH733_008606 [Mirounga leonina]|nr:hypothetical protein GH733_008606 [Mirounga leonina]
MTTEKGTRASAHLSTMVNYGPQSVSRHRVLGKGWLPRQPVLVKAIFFSKRAEKIRGKGGDETNEIFNSPQCPGAAEFTGNGNGQVGLHDMQETAGSARLESSHLRGGRSLYAKGQHPGHRGRSWGAAATATAVCKALIQNRDLTAYG